MLKKLVLILLSVSWMFAAINVQTATKKELMSIQGIGEKKAEAIVEYRKEHILNSAEDLMQIKGIGKHIVENVKGDVKNKKGEKKQ